MGMESIMDNVPVFNHVKVNLGLGISGATMVVIMIICMATHGWVVDWSNLNCDFSLQEAKCGTSTFDLKGDTKDAADAMAGLGSVALLALVFNFVVNCIILSKKCVRFYKIMVIGAMISCFVCWFFLTCGWGQYADKKGGTSGGGSVSYGASFAFIILIWLALWPYAFFWVVLFKMVSRPEEDGHEPQVDTDAENAYPQPTGTAKQAQTQPPVYHNQSSNQAEGGAMYSDHAGQKMEQASPKSTQPPSPPTSQEEHQEPAHQEPEHHEPAHQEPEHDEPARKDSPPNI